MNTRPDNLRLVEIDGTRYLRQFKREDGDDYVAWYVETERGFELVDNRHELEMTYRRYHHKFA